MSNSSIQSILSAPITLLRPADNKERGLFPDKKEGWFYTLELKSEQSFVVHIDRNKDIFTLRPKNNLLSNLTQIEWRKKVAYDDLGYDTICQTKQDISPAEKSSYHGILDPIPADNKLFPFTKIAFKHYHYPSILDRLITLKGALITCENIQQNLLQAQKRLHCLQITENNDTMSTQQKQSEGR